MNKFTTNKKNGLRRVIVGTFIATILIVVIINLVRNWQTSRSIDTEILELQNTASTLEQENVEFRQLIEYFNSSAYVEERARIDLGLKKPGEKVVIVPGDLATTTPSTTEQSAGKSNIQKWIDFLFN